MSYYGGKLSRLDWLLPQLETPHKTYCELFAGSAAVLLNKPRASIEVLNDASGDVVAFWTAMRECPDALAAAVENTPAGEAEYNRVIGLPPTDDVVERARRFHLRTCQSFSNIPNHKHQSFLQGLCYRRMRYRVGALADRLRDVVVENTDTNRLLQRMVMTDKASYCCSPILFYADPPYTTDSRKSHCVEYLVEDFDHEAFLDVVTAAPDGVKFAISGYDNPLYNDRLAGWHRAEKTSTYFASNRVRKGSGQTRTEVLWRNYELADNGLFDST